MAVNIDLEILQPSKAINYMAIGNTLSIYIYSCGFISFAATLCFLFQKVTRNNNNEKNKDDTDATHHQTCTNLSCIICLQELCKSSLHCVEFGFGQIHLMIKLADISLLFFQLSVELLSLCLKVCCNMSHLFDLFILFFEKFILNSFLHVFVH